jgi:transcriptional regulator of acetoin/glycerol metabolism
VLLIPVGQGAADRGELLSWRVQRLVGALVVASGAVLEAKDLPVQVTGAPPRPSPGSLADAEKAHILSVLGANRWNISRSARALDVDRVTLYNKIRRYELKRPVDAP